MNLKNCLRVLDQSEYIDERERERERGERERERERERGAPQQGNQVM